MNPTDTMESVDGATGNLEGMVGLMMDIEHGSVSAEPRTIEAEFPAPRQTAMAFAANLVEMLAEENVSAEAEYISEGELDTIHRVDIHIEGGGE